MCSIYFKYADYVYAQQRRKTTQNWFLNRGSPWWLQLETSLRGVSPNSLNPQIYRILQAAPLDTQPPPPPTLPCLTQALEAWVWITTTGPTDLLLPAVSPPCHWSFFTSTPNLVPFLSASPQILPQSCKSHLYMSYSGGFFFFKLNLTMKSRP